MTTSGIYYYQPSAGTGNLLLSNPPFIFQSMDTNQSTPAEGLPELTEEEFRELSGNVFIGCSGLPVRICSYEDALRIARAAYQLGADVELEACCEWLRGFGFRVAIDAFCAARRPKPPSLREQALEALNRQERGRDRGALRPEAMADADIIRRALEALPE